MTIDTTLLRQFVKFGGVGLITTGLQYAVLVGAVELLHVAPVSASSAGYLISSVVSYVLNYHFTFQSTSSHHVAIGRFVTVAAIGLALNTALMGLLVHLLEVPYILAQLISTTVVLVWNFFGNALWSFASRSRDIRNMIAGDQK